jgi:hypothetical protein
MKISVAMTTYNGERFLKEQLDSIFAQSRLPDELIVCDDRSSDDTPAILSEFAGRAPFPMSVIVNDERLGSTRNFEKAIGLCSGELIALCDQDDLWRPHKLETFERAFSADPELGVVLTNADLIDKDGAPLRGDLWSRCRLTPTRQEHLRTSRLYDLLLGLPIATGATMAFRSRFKPLVLPFPTSSATFIHDRWIALVIAAVGKLAIIPDKLIAYRLHAQQQLGVGKVPLPLKAFIPHQCRSDALGLAALHDRLAGNPACADNADFWRSLRERQRHTTERAQFSRNPLRRAGQVATEFRTGRYARYPFPVIFPVKDLLVGTR